MVYQRTEGYVMERVLKSKWVSAGLVEVKDAGTSSTRYRLYVAGHLKEVSDDLSAIMRCYDRYY